MRKQKKNTIIILIVVLAIILATTYYYFFYKPSATTLAENLDMYTGDPLLDGLLNNMISTALASSGTIKSSGNLEWELNDAASRLKTPLGTAEDYWRINGILYPAGALLATIDSTHDYYQFDPAYAGQDAGNAYIPQSALNQLWDLFNDAKHTMEL